MKAYEALALGRHLIRPRAGVVLTDDRTEGCALGMIYQAAGSAGASDLRHWLSGRAAAYPCDCYRSNPEFQRPVIQDIVAHIFDKHIMSVYNRNVDKLWTLDQLIDWLRAQEPEMKAEVKETNECTDLTRALVAHS